MTTTIVSCDLLPFNPLAGSNIIALMITNDVPNFYRVTGANLQDIVDVNWYPEFSETVKFIVRQLILVDSTEGTFMIKVIDNFLNLDERGGRMSFRLKDGTTISVPVQTVGSVSISPLWQSPYAGVDTA
jgi:hypothetical protein